MLKNFFSEEFAPVQEQIDRIVLEMDQHDPVSDEYIKLITRLKALQEIKTLTSRKPVSSDTIALITANCVVTLIVLNFERTHVIVTKMWGQLIRPKGL